MSSFNNKRSKWIGISLLRTLSEKIVFSILLKLIGKLLLFQQILRDLMTLENNTILIKVTKLYAFQIRIFYKATLNWPHNQ